MIELITAGSDSGAESGAHLAAALSGISDALSTPSLEQNIINSDGTLLVVGCRLSNVDSQKTKAVVELVKMFHKPYWIIDCPGVQISGEVVKEIARWARNKQVKILNVTGDWEATCGGLEEYTMQLVMKVIEMKEEEL